MLYELAHKIQEKTPFVWDAVEELNSVLFVMRCGRKLKTVPGILSQHNGAYTYRLATLDDIDALTHFFVSQNQEDFHFFSPHKFDAATIRKLIKRRSHLFFVVCDKEGRIAGYYFLRCFFIGRSFLGKYVGREHRGLSIGKEMSLSAMDVANSLGLNMFGTISPKNKSSLHSAQSALRVHVIKELSDGSLYLKYTLK